MADGKISDDALIAAADLLLSSSIPVIQSGNKRILISALISGLGLLGDIANVKDYGAVGDGVTNDRTAIQAAIDSGKTVVFPIGTYAIGSALTLSTNGKTIYGNRAILLRTTNFDALTISGHRNLVEGLVIAGGDYTGTGILLTGDYNTVRDCEAYDCYDGFKMYHAAGNPGADLNTFENCYAHNNNNAGFMLENGTDACISNCTSQSNGKAGLESKAYSYSARIIGCCFDDNNHTGGAGNVNLGTADGTNVVGCTITNANSSAHGIYFATNVATQTGIGISGCAIAQNEGRGILIDSGSGRVCNKIRIINNRINDNDAVNDPIFIGSGCTGTIIVGNDLSGRSISNSGTSTVTDNNN
jgi:hypothetical protein